MISVTTAVTQVVENSEFARKGLQEGLLNISAYAKIIHSEVEEMTKKEIKNDSSIIMALSRYGRRLQENPRPIPDLRIANLASRSGLVEISYVKTPEIQERLAMLNLLDSIKNAPFFVSTVGVAEVVIIVDASLADMVLGHFGTIAPLARAESLAGLMVRMDATAGDSYKVLERLAAQKITIVNYATGPTELHVILYEKDASRAFQILHATFLKSK